MNASKLDLDAIEARAKEDRVIQDCPVCHGSGIIDGGRRNCTGGCHDGRVVAMVDMTPIRRRDAEAIALAGDVVALVARVRELEAQLAEAGKDGARLDAVERWAIAFLDLRSREAHTDAVTVEQFRADCTDDCEEIGCDHPRENEYRVLGSQGANPDPWSTFHHAGTGTTLREAIDDALAKEARDAAEDPTEAAS